MCVTIHNKNYNQKATYLYRLLGIVFLQTTLLSTTPEKEPKTIVTTIPSHYQYQ